MIIAETLDCTVMAAKSLTSATVQCAGTGNSRPSDWEIASAYANWGILVIALAALIISYRSMHHAKKQSEETLKQNYAATKAQLEQAREASQTDIRERRQSRELDITASLVTALDEMQMVIVRHPNDPGRSEAVQKAASNSMTAFSRFSLFVGQSPILAKIQIWLVGAQSNFEPTSEEDFDSPQFERILQVQAALRLGVMEFQSTRELPGMYLLLQAALLSNDLQLVDQLLTDNIAQD